VQCCVALKCSKNVFNASLQFLFSEIAVWTHSLETY
jgi:hypothetical protein